MHGNPKTVGIVDYTAKHDSDGAESS